MWRRVLVYLVLVITFVLVFLALLMGLKAAYAAESWSVPPQYQSGGNVLRYEEMVREFDEAGVAVRVDALSCSSGCTLFLTARDVCVDRRTLLRFHGPSAAWTAAVGAVGVPVGIMTHGMTDENRAYWIDWMADLYDSRWPGLGTWFIENAAHKFGFQYTTVRGQTLHRTFGIPICNG